MEDGIRKWVILVSVRWSPACHLPQLRVDARNLYYWINTQARTSASLITTSTLHNAYQTNFQPGCRWNCVDASLDRTSLLYLRVLPHPAPCCTGELEKFMMSSSMFIYDGAEDRQLYICIPHEVHLCVCVKPLFSF